MNHRAIVSSSREFQSLRRPFSNFDYIEDRFQAQPAIRRLFSQSRSFDGKTLVLEKISASGVIAAENEEILEQYPDHRMEGLLRITFWTSAFASDDELDQQPPEKLLGYAILKRDVVPNRNYDRWHIFESVFCKHPHEHNYVPGTRAFRLRVGRRVLTRMGVLYCQQNGLNKACAQVALRSICAQHIDDAELPYRKINCLAASASPMIDPAKGLDAVQIRAVLNGLKIGFTDVDYANSSDKTRRDLPYQKFLYAGIESGAGALLGFELSGPRAQGQYHIVPFFGHTFNQDTWVPNAETGYFHVGEKTRYIPSEAWLSSFIGHDDNFGSNFCVPRLYVKPEQVQYVATLYPSTVRYSGVIAEAIAVDYLYSILPEFGISDEKWLRRLLQYSNDQQVVLRALPMSNAEYTRHLSQIDDWNHKREKTSICFALKRHLPDNLWVVEVSLPELFPANHRKLGEIVLDATKAATQTRDFSTFLFARFPGRFVFLGKMNRDGKPEFVIVPSALKSHTPLYTKKASAE